MTFINEVNMLLKKSNGNLAILNIDGGIKYELLNNNLSKILNKKIYDGNFSYINTWFDINKDDSIYGIIDNNKGNLIKININDDIISSSTLIKYDIKILLLSFLILKF